MIQSNSTMYCGEFNSHPNSETEKKPIIQLQVLNNPVAGVLSSKRVFTNHIDAQNLKRRLKSLKQAHIESRDSLMACNAFCCRNESNSYRR